MSRCSLLLFCSRRCLTVCVTVRRALGILSFSCWGGTPALPSNTSFASRLRVDAPAVAAGHLRAGRCSLGFRQQPGADCAQVGLLGTGPGADYVVREVRHQGKFEWPDQPSRGEMLQHERLASKCDALTADSGLYDQGSIRASQTLRHVYTRYPCGSHPIRPPRPMATLRSPVSVDERLA